MEDRRKNLREFLLEEQEPFDLKIFIAERKQQLQRRQKRGSSSSAPPSPLPEALRSPILVDFGGVKAARRPEAAFLLVEAAMRVAAGKKKKASRGSIKGLGIAIFGSILRRLAFRKRVYELEKEDEEKGFIIVGAKKEPLHSGTTSGVAINGVRRVQTPDRVMGSDEDEDEDEKEASFGRRSTSSDISTAPEPRSSCSSSSAAAIGSSSSGGATPESSPPASFLPPRRGAGAAAAAVDQLLVSQRQLFSCRGGDNGGGSARKEKEDEEHEQCSPASVLEPIFDAAAGEDDGDGEEQEAHLRGVIRRLDELEVEEEEGEEGEDAVIHRDLEKEDAVIQIVRSILDHGGKKRNLCSGGVLVPRDVEMLVSDLVGEERSGGDAAVEEAVWKRMDAWDEDGGGDDVERAVEMDLRSEEWQRCRVEAEDVGDAVELALLDLLVCDLSGELMAEYSCNAAAMSSCVLQEC